MKKRNGFLLVILLVLSQMAQSQKVINRYITRFLPTAQALSTEFGIPVSIILGVSILESGSGTSLNCKQLNNYFGVTGKNQLKKRKTMYKQYPDAEASFRDFCGIVSRKKYYPKLKNNMNYRLWLTAMNKANYAGAKQVWINRVTSLIVKHHLATFDQQ